MWGTSSVEGEQSQKPEYQVCVCAWIILVYISWLTALWSSPDPSHLFLLLSYRWSTSGRAQILPVRESAERGLWTQLPSTLASNSAIIRLLWGLARWVAFLKRAAEEIQRRKSSASLVILIFSGSKDKLFCFLQIRKSSEISNKTCFFLWTS